MPLQPAQAHRLHLAKMAALSSSSFIEEFIEEFSSDSDLDENELDRLVSDQVPQNTQNSTRWAVNAFEGKLKFIYLFSNKLRFICRFWFKYYMHTVKSHVRFQRRGDGGPDHPHPYKITKI